MKKRILAVALAAVAASGLAYKLTNSGGSHQAPGKPQSRETQRTLPPVQANLFTPAGTSNAQAHVFAIAHPKGTIAIHGKPFGKIVATVGPQSDLGQMRVLAVVGKQPGWYAVLDPDVYNRPGWVQSSQVTLTFTRVEIDVSLSRHRLQLLVDGKVKRTIIVGIGAARTPTPLGRFAVVDRFSPQPFSHSYGCCILGLSGHQPHLRAGWPGGDRLAIHGTDLPSTIGRNESNGCLHASTADMHYLMSVVPFGAPVFIRR